MGTEYVSEAEILHFLQECHVLRMTIYEYDPDEPDGEEYDWDSRYWPIIDIDRIANYYDDDDLANTMAGWLMDLSLGHVIYNVELDSDEYL